MNSPKLVASPLQVELLQHITHQVTAAVYEVVRAKLILAMVAGKSNAAIQQQLGYSWAKAKRWRYRWIDLQPKLTQIETNGPPHQQRLKVEQALREALADAPRSGSPGKFSAQQYCQILAVAVEDPALSGRPISQWSLTELTQEVIQRAIVPRISRAQVGAFLKRERGETA